MIGSGCPGYARLPLLLSLIITVALAASCGHETAETATRSLSAILARTPASSDLSPYLLAAGARADAPGYGRISGEMALATWIDVAAQRPSLRRQASDTLAVLLKRDPTRLVWIDTAQRLYYLLFDVLDYGSISKSTPFDDTESVAGAFWIGNWGVEQGRGAEHLAAVVRHEADLDSLSVAVLARARATLAAARGDRLGAVRLLLEYLPYAAGDGAAAELLFWEDIAAYLGADGRAADALQAAVTASRLAAVAGDPYRQVETLISVGEALALLGETTPARDRWRDAAARARRGDHPWLELAALDDLATSTSADGDLDETLRCDRRAASLAAVVDSINVPPALASLADDYLKLGYPDSAAAAIREARVWSERLPGRQDKTLLLLHEAEVACFRGEFARADSLLAVAAPEAEDLFGPEQIARLWLEILKMGREMDRSDIVARAQQRLHRLADALVAAAPGYHPAADLSLLSAEFLSRQGEYRRAATALDFADSVLGRHGSADMTWELARRRGELATRRGDLGTAADELARALSIAERLDQPDKLLRSRRALAAVLIAEGRTREARRLFSGVLNDTLFSGSYRARLAGRLMVGRAWLVEGRPDSALVHLDRGLAGCRPGALADLTARLETDRGLALDRLDRPAEAQRALLAAWGAISDHHADIPADLSRPGVSLGRTIVSRLLSLWWRRPHLLSTGDPAAVTLRWARRILYGASAPPDPEAGEGPAITFFIGETRSFRWMRAPGGDLTWRALPGHDALRRLLDPIVFDLGRPDRPVDRDALVRLSGILLADLPATDDTVPLVITPDDLLWSVPWYALPLAATADREEATLLDAGPVLLVSTTRPADTGRPAARGNGLLALGLDGTPDDDEATYLRHAEAEAHQVASLWPARPATCLTGDRARWATLDSLDLSPYAVIHLATHATVLHGAGGGSTLRLADAGRSEPITLDAVSALTLNADLVFLSCCEAARPLAGGGSGLDALAGAFLRAGARNVIASGSLVDDDASLALAVGFYGRLAEGESLEIAFWHALRELRADPRWRHPFYWGNYRLMANDPKGESRRGSRE